MRERVKRVFRYAEDAPDLIVLLNSVEPHIDMSFFYATGLADGLFEGCAAWLMPDGSCGILTSAMEEEAARKSRLTVQVFGRRDEADRLLAQRLKGHRRIGVNASELTHGAFLRLRRLAPKSSRFLDVSTAFTRARLVKDSREIERIRRACAIASRSFEEVLPAIQPGVKELDVAADLGYRIQRNGGSGPSFRTIVGSGPNGAEPHYTAGARRLRRGDLVVIDFGALYDLYCSDITRTVVLGKASPEQRRMYDTVAKAQAAALKKMRPGARGRAVDAAARSVVDASKYKGRFIHGLGHSIGLSVHDGGALNPSTDIVLKSKMVFTNEPGIYVPGFGGVRIEDDVLIGKSGPEILTSASRDLLEL